MANKNTQRYSKYLPFIDLEGSKSATDLNEALGIQQSQAIEDAGPQLPWTRSLLSAGYAQPEANDIGVSAAKLEGKNWNTLIGNRAGIRDAPSMLDNYVKDGMGSLASLHGDAMAVDLRAVRDGKFVEDDQYFDDLGEAANESGFEQLKSGKDRAHIQRKGAKASYDKVDKYLESRGSSRSEISKLQNTESTHEAARKSWESKMSLPETQNEMQSAVDAALQSSAEKASKPVTDKQAQPYGPENMLPVQQTVTVLNQLYNMGYDEDVVEWMKNNGDFVSDIKGSN